MREVITMKLYRFTASDQHKAILKAQEVLGPDALIYVTRKVYNGIEVLAGIEEGSERATSSATIVSQELELDNTTVDHRIIENLNVRIQLMDKNIRRLTSNIDLLKQAMVRRSKIWNILTLGFITDLFKKPRNTKHIQDEEDEDDYGTESIR